MKSKKEAIVQEIGKRFIDFDSIIFYNFHYVDNEEIFKLRQDLKENNAYWKVYKNNLVKKALLTDYPSITLCNANSFVFCKLNEEYKVLKILFNFNKKHKKIKRLQGGIFERKLVDSNTLEDWAKLPSKEVLLSELCNVLLFKVRILNILLGKI